MGSQRDCEGDRLLHSVLRCNNTPWNESLFRNDWLQHVFSEL
jgi:hypothetical protein